MKQLLLLSLVLLMCLSVKGQTVVVQPVVCTSTADGGNIAITSTPVISAEDASIFYQGGFISFVPGSADAGVKNIVTDDSVTEEARYDIHGRKLNEPTTGINIIKMSDGSTRKEAVK